MVRNIVELLQDLLQYLNGVKEANSVEEQYNVIT